MNSTKEQGSILIYAAIVITFLAGLAGYLRSISSPAIFDSNGTRKLLQTSYTISSIKNIFSTVACKNIQSSLVATSDPNDSSPILNHYTYFEIIHTSNKIISKTSTTGENNISYQNGSAILSAKIKVTTNTTNSETVGRFFTYSTNIGNTCIYQ